MKKVINYMRKKRSASRDGEPHKLTVDFSCDGLSAYGSSDSVVSSNDAISIYEAGTANKNWTKLHVAAWVGDIPKMQSKLRKIHIDAKDDIGRTSLHLAAAQGHTNAVAFLLACKADDSVQDENGKTPLYKAMEFDHRECVGLLLERGASGVINISDTAGNTPLHVAARLGSYHLTLMLLQKGANLEKPNNEGQLPLHKACLSETRDTHELVELLLRYGGLINVSDNFNVTPLMLASGKGIVNIVRLFMEYGADKTARDNRGKAAYHYALENHFYDIEDLVKFDDDLQAPDMERILKETSSQESINVISPPEQFVHHNGNSLELRVENEEKDDFNSSWDESDFSKGENKKKLVPSYEDAAKQQLHSYAQPADASSKGSQFLSPLLDPRRDSPEHNHYGQGDGDASNKSSKNIEHNDARKVYTPNRDDILNKVDSPDKIGGLEKEESVKKVDVLDMVGGFNKVYSLDEVDNPSKDNSDEKDTSASDWEDDFSLPIDTNSRLSLKKSPFHISNKHVESKNPDKVQPSDEHEKGAIDDYKKTAEFSLNNFERRISAHDLQNSLQMKYSEFDKRNKGMNSNKVHSLERVESPTELDSLNELNNLNDTNSLDKVDNLEELDNLNDAVSLKKVNLLEQVDILEKIDSLNKVDSTNEVDNLNEDNAGDTETSRSDWEDDFSLPIDKDSRLVSKKKPLSVSINYLINKSPAATQQNGGNSAERKGGNSDANNFYEGGNLEAEKSGAIDSIVSDVGEGKSEEKKLELEVQAVQFDFIDEIEDTYSSEVDRKIACSKILTQIGASEFPAERADGIFEEGDAQKKCMTDLKTENKLGTGNIYENKTDAAEEKQMSPRKMSKHLIGDNFNVEQNDKESYLSEFDKNAQLAKSEIELELKTKFINKIDNAEEMLTGARNISVHFVSDNVEENDEIKYFSKWDKNAGRGKTESQLELENRYTKIMEIPKHLIGDTFTAEEKGESRLDKNMESHDTSIKSDFGNRHESSLCEFDDSDNIQLSPVKITEDLVSDNEDVSNCSSSLTNVTAQFSVSENSEIEQNNKIVGSIGRSSMNKIFDDCNIVPGIIVKDTKKQDNAKTELMSSHKRNSKNQDYSFLKKNSSEESIDDEHENDLSSVEEGVEIDHGRSGKSKFVEFTSFRDRGARNKILNKSEGACKKMEVYEALVPLSRSGLESSGDFLNREFKALYIDDDEIDRNLKSNKTQQTQSNINNCNMIPVIKLEPLLTRRKLQNLSEHENSPRVDSDSFQSSNSNDSLTNETHFCDKDQKSGIIEITESKINDSNTLPITKLNPRLAQRELKNLSGYENTPGMDSDSSQSSSSNDSLTNEINFCNKDQKSGVIEITESKINYSNTLPITKLNPRLGQRKLKNLSGYENSPCMDSDSLQSSNSNDSLTNEINFCDKDQKSGVIAKTEPKINDSNTLPITKLNPLLAERELKNLSEHENSRGIGADSSKSSNSNDSLTNEIHSCDRDKKSGVIEPTESKVNNSHMLPMKLQPLLTRRKLRKREKNLFKNNYCSMPSESVDCDASKSASIRETFDYISSDNSEKDDGNERNIVQCYRKNPDEDSTKLYLLRQAMTVSSLNANMLRGDENICNIGPKNVVADTHNLTSSLIVQKDSNVNQHTISENSTITHDNSNIDPRNIFTYIHNSTVICDDSHIGPNNTSANIQNLTHDDPHVNTENVPSESHNLIMINNNSNIDPINVSKNIQDTASSPMLHNDFHVNAENISSDSNNAIMIYNDSNIDTQDSTSLPMSHKDSYIDSNNIPLNLENSLSSPSVKLQFSNAYLDCEETLDSTVMTTPSGKTHEASLNVHNSQENHGNAAFSRRSIYEVVESAESSPIKEFIRIYNLNSQLNPMKEIVQLPRSCESSVKQAKIDVSPTEQLKVDRYCRSAGDGPSVSLDEKGDDFKLSDKMILPWVKDVNGDDFDNDSLNSTASLSDNEIKIQTSIIMEDSLIESDAMMSVDEIWISNEFILDDDGIDRSRNECENNDKSFREHRGGNHEETDNNIGMESESKEEIENITKIEMVNALQVSHSSFNVISEIENKNNEFDDDMIFNDKREENLGVTKESEEEIGNVTKMHMENALRDLHFPHNVTSEIENKNNEFDDDMIFNDKKEENIGVTEESKEEIGNVTKIDMKNALQDSHSPHDVISEIRNKNNEFDDDMTFNDEKRENFGITEESKEEIGNVTKIDMGNALHDSHSPHDVISEIRNKNNEFDDDMIFNDKKEENIGVTEESKEEIGNVTKIDMKNALQDSHSPHDVISEIRNKNNEFDDDMTFNDEKRENFGITEESKEEIGNVTKIDMKNALQDSHFPHDVISEIENRNNEFDNDLIFNATKEEYISVTTENKEKVEIIKKREMKNAESNLDNNLPNEKGIFKVACHKSNDEQYSVAEIQNSKNVPAAEKLAQYNNSSHHCDNSNYNRKRKNIANDSDIFPMCNDSIPNIIELRVMDDEYINRESCNHDAKSETTIKEDKSPFSVKLNLNGNWGKSIKKHGNIVPGGTEPNRLPDRVSERMTNFFVIPESSSLPINALQTSDATSRNREENPVCDNYRHVLSRKNSGNRTNLTMHYLSRAESSDVLRMKFEGDDNICYAREKGNLSRQSEDNICNPRERSYLSSESSLQNDDFEIEDLAFKNVETTSNSDCEKSKSCAENFLESNEKCLFSNALEKKFGNVQKYLPCEGPVDDQHNYSPHTSDEEVPEKSTIKSSLRNDKNKRNEQKPEKVTDEEMSSVSDKPQWQGIGMCKELPREGKKPLKPRELSEKGEEFPNTNLYNENEAFKKQIEEKHTENESLICEISDTVQVTESSTVIDSSKSSYCQKQSDSELLAEIDVHNAHKLIECAMATFSFPSNKESIDHLQEISGRGRNSIVNFGCRGNYRDERTPFRQLINNFQNFLFMPDDEASSAFIDASLEGRDGFSGVDLENEDCFGRQLEFSETDKYSTEKSNEEEEKDFNKKDEVHEGHENLVVTKSPKSGKIRQSTEVIGGSEKKKMDKAQNEPEKRNKVNVDDENKNFAVINNIHHATTARGRPKRVWLKHNKNPQSFESIEHTNGSVDYVEETDIDKEKKICAGMTKLDEAATVRERHKRVSMKDKENPESLRIIKITSKSVYSHEETDDYDDKGLGGIPNIRRASTPQSKSFRVACLGKKTKRRSSKANFLCNKIKRSHEGNKCIGHKRNLQFALVRNRPWIGDGRRGKKCRKNGQEKYKKALYSVLYAHQHETERTVDEIANERSVQTECEMKQFNYSFAQELQVEVENMYINATKKINCGNCMINSCSNCFANVKPSTALREISVGTELGVNVETEVQTDGKLRLVALNENEKNISVESHSDHFTIVSDQKDVLRNCRISEKTEIKKKSVDGTRLPEQPKHCRHGKKVEQSEVIEIKQKSELESTADELHKNDKHEEKCENSRETELQKESKLQTIVNKSILLEQQKNRRHEKECRISERNEIIKESEEQPSKNSSPQSISKKCASSRKILLQKKILRLPENCDTYIKPRKPKEIENQLFPVSSSIKIDSISSQENDESLEQEGHSENRLVDSHIHLKETMSSGSSFWAAESFEERTNLGSLVDLQYLIAGEYSGEESDSESWSTEAQVSQENLHKRLKFLANLKSCLEREADADQPMKKMEEDYFLPCNNSAYNFEESTRNSDTDNSSEGQMLTKNFAFNTHFIEPQQDVSSALKQSSLSTAAAISGSGEVTQNIPEFHGDFEKAVYSPQSDCPVTILRPKYEAAVSKMTAVAAELESAKMGTTISVSGGQKELMNVGSDVREAVTLLREDYRMVEATLKKHNCALAALALKLRSDGTNHTGLMREKKSTLRHFEQFEKNSHLKKELEYLRLKVATKRLDENTKTLETASRLQQENRELRATINGLNQSLVDHRIKVTELKDRNKKYKQERKILQDELGAHTAELDYLAKRSIPNDPAVVRKIGKLEEQNRELAENCANLTKILGERERQFASEFASEENGRSVSMCENESVVLDDFQENVCTEQLRSNLEPKDWSTKYKQERKTLQDEPEAHTAELDYLAKKSTPNDPAVVRKIGKLEEQNRELAENCANLTKILGERKRQFASEFASEENGRSVSMCENESVVLDDFQENVCTEQLRSNVEPKDWNTKYKQERKTLQDELEAHTAELDYLAKRSIPNDPAVVRKIGKLEEQNKELAENCANLTKILGERKRQFASDFASEENGRSVSMCENESVVLDDFQENVCTEQLRSNLEPKDWNTKYKQERKTLQDELEAHTAELDYLAKKSTPNDPAVVRKIGKLEEQNRESAENCANMTKILGERKRQFASEFASEENGRSVSMCENESVVLDDFQENVCTEQLRSNFEPQDWNTKYKQKRKTLQNELEAHTAELDDLAKKSIPNDPVVVRKIGMLEEWNRKSAENCENLTKTLDKRKLQFSSELTLEEFGRSDFMYKNESGVLEGSPRNFRSEQLRSNVEVCASETSMLGEEESSEEKRMKFAEILPSGEMKCEEWLGLGSEAENRKDEICEDNILGGMSEQANKYDCLPQFRMNFEENNFELNSTADALLNSAENEKKSEGDGFERVRSPNGISQLKQSKEKSSDMFPDRKKFSRFGDCKEPAKPLKLYKMIRMIQEYKEIFHDGEFEVASNSKNRNSKVRLDVPKKQKEIGEIKSTALENLQVRITESSCFDGEENKREAKKCDGGMSYEGEKYDNYPLSRSQEKNSLLSSIANKPVNSAKNSDGDGSKRVLSFTEICQLKQSEENSDERFPRIKKVFPLRDGKHSKLQKMIRMIQEYKEIFRNSEFELPSKSKKRNSKVRLDMPKEQEKKGEIKSLSFDHSEAKGTESSCNYQLQLRHSTGFPSDISTKSTSSIGIVQTEISVHNRLLIENEVSVPSTGASTTSFQSKPNLTAKTEILVNILPHSEAVESFFHSDAFSENVVSGNVWEYPVKNRESLLASLVEEHTRTDDNGKSSACLEEKSTDICGKNSPYLKEESSTTINLKTGSGKKVSKEKLQTVENSDSTLTEEQRTITVSYGKSFPNSEQNKSKTENLKISLGEKSPKDQFHPKTEIFEKALPKHWSSENDIISMEKSIEDCGTFVERTSLHFCMAQAVVQAIAKNVEDKILVTHDTFPGTILSSEKMREVINGSMVNFVAHDLHDNVAIANFASADKPVAETAGDGAVDFIFVQKKETDQNEEIGNFTAINEATHQQISYNPDMKTKQSENVIVKTSEIIIEKESNAEFIKAECLPYREDLQELSGVSSVASEEFTKDEEMNISNPDGRHSSVDVDNVEILSLSSMEKHPQDQPIDTKIIRFPNETLHLSEEKTLTTSKVDLIADKERNSELCILSDTKLSEKVEFLLPREVAKIGSSAIGNDFVIDEDEMYVLQSGEKCRLSRSIGVGEERVRKNEGQLYCMSGTMKDEIEKHFVVYEDETMEVYVLQSGEKLRLSRSIGVDNEMMQKAEGQLFHEGVTLKDEIGKQIIDEDKTLEKNGEKIRLTRSIGVGDERVRKHNVQLSCQGVTMKDEVGKNIVDGDKTLRKNGEKIGPIRSTGVGDECLRKNERQLSCISETMKNEIVRKFDVDEGKTMEVYVLQSGEKLRPTKSIGVGDERVRENGGQLFCKDGTMKGEIGKNIVDEEKTCEVNILQNGEKLRLFRLIGIGDERVRQNEDQISCKGATKDIVVDEDKKLEMKNCEKSSRTRSIGFGDERVGKNEGQLPCKCGTMQDVLSIAIGEDIPFQGFDENDSSTPEKGRRKCINVAQEEKLRVDSIGLSEPCSFMKAKAMELPTFINMKLMKDASTFTNAKSMREPCTFMDAESVEQPFTFANEGLKENPSTFANTRAIEKFTFTNAKSTEELSTFTNAKSTETLVTLTIAKSMEKPSTFTNANVMERASTFTDAQPLEQLSTFTSATLMDEASLFMNAKSIGKTSEATEVKLMQKMPTCTNAKSMGELSSSPIVKSMEKPAIFTEAQKVKSIEKPFTEKESVGNTSTFTGAQPMKKPSKFTNAKLMENPSTFTKAKLIEKPFTEIQPIKKPSKLTYPTLVENPSMFTKAKPMEKPFTEAESMKNPSTFRGAQPMKNVSKLRNAKLIESPPEFLKAKPIEKTFTETETMEKPSTFTGAQPMKKSTPTKAKLMEDPPVFAKAEPVSSITNCVDNANNNFKIIVNIEPNVFFQSAKNSDKTNEALPITNKISITMVGLQSAEIFSNPTAINNSPVCDETNEKNIKDILPKKSSLCRGKKDRHSANSVRFDPRVECCTTIQGSELSSTRPKNAVKFATAEMESSTKNLEPSKCSSCSEFFHEGQLSKAQPLIEICQKHRGENDRDGPVVTEGTNHLSLLPNTSQNNEISEEHCTKHRQENDMDHRCETVKSVSTKMESFTQNLDLAEHRSSSEFLHEWQLSKIQPALNAVERLAKDFGSVAASTSSKTFETSSPSNPSQLLNNSQNDKIFMGNCPQQKRETKKDSPGIAKETNHSPQLLNTSQTNGKSKGNGEKVMKENGKKHRDPAEHSFCSEFPREDHSSECQRALNIVETSTEDSSSVESAISSKTSRTPKIFTTPIPCNSLQLPNVNQNNVTSTKVGLKHRKEDLKDGPDDPKETNHPSSSPNTTQNNKPSTENHPKQRIENDKNRQFVGKIAENDCQLSNMSKKHRICMQNSSIHGTDFAVTSFSKKDSSSPVILVGGHRSEAASSVTCSMHPGQPCCELERFNKDSLSPVFLVGGHRSEAFSSILCPIRPGESCRDLVQCVSESIQNSREDLVRGIDGLDVKKQLDAMQGLREELWRIKRRILEEEGALREEKERFWVERKVKHEVENMCLGNDGGLESLKKEVDELIEILAEKEGSTKVTPFDIFTSNDALRICSIIEEHSIDKPINQNKIKNLNVNIEKEKKIAVESVCRVASLFDDFSLPDSPKAEKRNKSTVDERLNFPAAKKNVVKIMESTGENMYGITSQETRENMDWAKYQLESTADFTHCYAEQEAFPTKLPNFGKDNLARWTPFYEINPMDRDEQLKKLDAALAKARSAVQSPLQYPSTKLVVQTPKNTPINKKTTRNILDKREFDFGRSSLKIHKNNPKYREVLPKFGIHKITNSPNKNNITSKSISANGKIFTPVGILHKKLDLRPKSAPENKPPFSKAYNSSYHDKKTEHIHDCRSEEISLKNLEKNSEVPYVIQKSTNSPNYNILGPNLSSSRMNNTTCISAGISHEKSRKRSPQNKVHFSKNYNPSSPHRKKLENKREYKSEDIALLNKIAERKLRENRDKIANSQSDAGLVRNSYSMTNREIRTPVGILQKKWEIFDSEITERPNFPDNEEEVTINNVKATKGCCVFPTISDDSAQEGNFHSTSRLVFKKKLRLNSLEGKRYEIIARSVVQEDATKKCNDAGEAFPLDDSVMAKLRSKYFAN